MANETGDIKFTCAYGASTNLPQPFSEQIQSNGLDYVPEQRLGSKNPTTIGEKMVFGKAFEAFKNGETGVANDTATPYVFKKDTDAPTVMAPYDVAVNQYGWFKIIKDL
ncbi:hypothetical protein FACS189496_3010 [Bacilli bacterium]|nr:hypothetical protein FACS189496_3010 [Bacilli bacterium]